MTENEKYVLEKIKHGDIIDTPWRHLVIKDFLPKKLYEGIKKEIAGYEISECLKKENIRAYHVYVNKSVNVYPSTYYLKEYYDTLLNSFIIDEIKKKLNLKQQPNDFYSELNFFTRGYVYDEIHPDRSDKLITMLHYLADEGDDTSLGTFLYTPFKDGKTLDIFEDRITSTQYISNCVLLFAPNDTPSYKTNHCMGNNSKKTFLRKSFQSFWIKEESDWTKDKQLGRIKL